MAGRITWSSLDGSAMTRIAESPRVSSRAGRTSHPDSRSTRPVASGPRNLGIGGGGGAKMQPGSMRTRRTQRVSRRICGLPFPSLEGVQLFPTREPAPAQAPPILPEESYDELRGDVRQLRDHNDLAPRRLRVLSGHDDVHPGPRRQELS